MPDCPIIEHIPSYMQNVVQNMRSLYAHNVVHEIMEDMYKYK